MVKFVNYNGEKLPISISFYALEQLEEEGLNLEEGSLKMFKRLFWHSLKAGHFHESKKLEVKEENSVFILDGCFGEFKELVPLFLKMITKSNGKVEGTKKQVIKK